MPKFRRAVMVIIGSVYLVVALGSLVVPRTMARGLGYSLDNTTALSEFRAVYVGLWCATAAIFGMSAARDQDRGLHWVCVLLVGGQVWGRVLSLCLDGVPGPSLWPTAVVETLGVVVLLLLARRGDGRRMTLGAP